MHRLIEPVMDLPLAGNLLRRWRVNRRYPVERKFIKGKIRPDSRLQSLVFFTIYRGGSSFLGSLLSRLAGDGGLLPVDLDGYFYDTGKGARWTGCGRVDPPLVYPKNGCYFGPYRSYHRGLGDLGDFKILLVVRDPRDAAVSGYFSLFSHGMPLTENRHDRLNRKERRWQKTGIPLDKYVLQKLETDNSQVQTYLDYIRYLLGRENVMVLTYEKMVTDFPSWFDRLLSFLPFEVGPSTRERILKETSFHVAAEDKRKHRRQVMPGDHLRKLSPETVKILNRRLEPILKAFHYL